MASRRVVALKTHEGTLYVDPELVVAVSCRASMSPTDHSVFVYIGADLAVPVAECESDILKKLGLATT